MRGGIRREKLKLIRNRNGDEIELLHCSVQNGQILSNDYTKPIESGDVIIRVLPSGLEERFTVVSVTTYTSLLPHHEIKIDKN